MAQADYSIANQGFPATRSEINSTLEAIATNNSGTTAPSTQYAGQFWIDTTSSTWTLYIHDGTDDIQFATIDTSANTVNFTDSALDVVTDTTPQLGGDLDSNGNNILFDDGTGINDDDDNELIRFQKIASAVNQIDISNSATGNAPEISATGDDTNIDLNLTPKGTGSIIIPNGKISGHNYPAFQAYLSSNQGSISSNTYTKVQFDTEFFDTDNCYDNSTNYRFTPTTPGKYFCYTSIGNSFTAGSPDDLRVRFYFNGSGASNLRETSLIDYAGAGISLVLTQQIQAIITFNGSSDYLEVYARNDGTPEFGINSYFGAYRIGA